MLKNGEKYIKTNSYQSNVPNQQFYYQKNIFKVMTIFWYQNDVFDNFSIFEPIMDIDFSPTPKMYTLTGLY